MTPSATSQCRLRAHASCSWYCHGTEHAILVTALPTVPLTALAACATAMGGCLRAARPAPEVDPATYRPEWDFDARTGMFTLIATHPPGVIVWRLQIDFVPGHPRPLLPPAGSQATRRQSVLRRLHHWLTSRRT